ncbi:MAG: M48 family metallopeptidase [Sphingomicrobium sp.]
MTQTGRWFDGTVATATDVTVAATSDGLAIAAADGRTVTMATDELVRLSTASGRVRIGHRSIEGWRLDLDQPVDPELADRLPRRGFSGATNAGKKAMAAAITVTAVATLALGTLIAAPEVLARHMPMSWEKKIGQIYQLPVGTVSCKDPAGSAALNNLIDRLDPEARKDGLTIQLLDVNDANAAALPGQRMIVFNGLFEEVGNADALAGIVAHEIAHVRRRHVATAMVRELGLSTVLTLFGGGALASGGGSLLSLNFTRGAETEADGDAIAMLRRAGIDPRKTKVAFDRFRARELDLPAWASSHPASAERGARFAASFDPGIVYRPALDAAATKSLFAACQGKPGKTERP